jgi:uncharacterized membrane protein
VNPVGCSADTALVSTWKQPRRAVVGAATAALFVAVFPGNVAQLTGHRDAFGLDTDTKRAIRLLFQPLLVAWALGATDARRVLAVARAPEPASSDLFKAREVLRESIEP